MIWIVFEGPDGAGKSTVIEGVKEELEKRGFRVFVTHEPSSGPIGKLIREWALKLRVNPPHLYALLFVADRYYHYYNVVKPALEQGYIVLQERYKESTIAYQAAMGLDIEWLEELNKYLPEPDLTIVLDLDVEELVERIAQRGKKQEVFENREFLCKVREIYLKRAREKGYPILNTKDTNKTKEKVLEYILDLLGRRNLLSTT